MDIHDSDSIPFILSRVMRLHRHHHHLQLQEYEVFPGQPPLLIQLRDQDGQRQNELAAKLRVQPATLTVMINRMAATGLLERRRDPEDQRVSRVYLTDKGRRAAAAVQEVFRETERRSMARITPEERMLLRRLLLQMYDNLQEPGDSPDNR